MLCLYVPGIMTKCAPGEVIDDGRIGCHFEN